MRQQMRQGHAARPARHPVGEDAIQPVLSAGARDLEFRHRGHFDQPGRSANRLALNGHMGQRIERPVAPDVPGLDALGREPERCLPTIDGPPDGACTVEPIMAWHHFCRARGRPFVSRIVDTEIMAERLLVAGPGPNLVRVPTETARIDLREIDMRLAIDDPVGDLTPNATAHQDATRHALGEPKIAQPWRRPG